MATTGYTRVRPNIARVQSLIPETLAIKLVDIAARSGRTVSAIIYESIAAHLADVSVPDRKAGRPPRRKYQRILPTT